MRILAAELLAEIVLICPVSIFDLRFAYIRQIHIFNVVSVCVTPSHGSCT